MFIFYLAAFAVLLLYFIHDVRINDPNPNDMGFVYVLSPYVIWLVIASIWGHEQVENKNRGYHLLAELPVRNISIILAKFFWVFFTTVIITAGLMGVYAFSPLKHAFLGYAREYTLFFGGLTLLFGGGSYLLIFRFGYSLFQKIALVFLVLVLAGPILLHLSVWKNLSSEELIFRLTRLPTTGIVFLCFAVFLILIPCALRLKESHKELSKG